MIKGAVARRYAEAILALAIEKNETERWEKDLQESLKLLDEKDLVNLLENPEVPTLEKKKIIRRLLGGKVSPLALNFMLLIVQRNRLENLPQIYAEYRLLLDDYRQTLVAEVTTAVELTKEQEEALRKRLGEITGKKVSLKVTVDPSLIGGLVAKVGDRLIDGSVTAKLEALREQLVHS